MRLVLLMALILVACGKDAPAPVNTSPDGKWTYTTPDKTIKVVFDMVSTSTTMADVVNPIIFVANVEGNAASQVDDINLPSIGSLRINANDAGLQYNYYITFTMCSVSADFNKILVADVEYTPSKGKTKTLSNISITRAP